MVPGGGRGLQRSRVSRPIAPPPPTPPSRPPRAQWDRHFTVVHNTPAPLPPPFTPPQIGTPTPPRWLTPLPPPLQSWGTPPQQTPHCASRAAAHSPPLLHLRRLPLFVRVSVVQGAQVPSLEGQPGLIWSIKTHPHHSGVCCPGLHLFVRLSFLHSIQLSTQFGFGPRRRGRRRGG